MARSLQYVLYVILYQAKSGLQMHEDKFPFISLLLGRKCLVFFFFSFRGRVFLGMGDVLAEGKWSYMVNLLYTIKGVITT